MYSITRPPATVATSSPFSARDRGHEGGVYQNVRQIFERPHRR